MNIRRKLQGWLPLFLISSLGLFLELAAVRWLSAEVRLFSYFKNLPLLAAFLGLAVGYALVGHGRNYYSAFAPMLTLFVVLVLLVGRVVSGRALAYPSQGDEFLWFTGTFSYWLALTVFLAMVVIFFLLTMFVFIPLGQAAGEEMARHTPLLAYTVNILASLVGVWTFSLLSYFQTSPAIWFGLALLGIVAYWGFKRILSRTDLLLFALVTTGLLVLDQGIIWSPYHRLSVVDLFLARKSDGQKVQVGYTLQVQQVFYQVALDLSPGYLAKLEGEIPEIEAAAYSYNLPYRFVSNRAQVLIVGAGLGNDVAAALRNNAEHVDAVEIDPAILTLGRELHPEHPYDDPRVTPVADDARSFFEKTPKQYDAIVFGLLDSHTLLSGLSNVRLDSFVYTVESFQQARSHLKENGVVAVTFGAYDQDWLIDRLGRILIQVFGPGNVLVYSGGTGITFVAGLATPKLPDTQVTVWQPNPAFDDLPLTTDNWPFLYLRKQVVPAAYWQALLLIGVVCLALLFRTFPEALRPNWHFWFLGAAFLLIEFKSITEFALLFGTTWLVNSLAISGVLLMSLLANLLVLRYPGINLRLVYALLFASLLLTYFFPLELLIGLPPSIRAFASLILLSMPMLFAGLIFGESIRRAKEIAGPLASNLSGSFIGGALEYGSLLWGIKSLYVIAAVVYLGAMLASRTTKK